MGVVFYFNFFFLVCVDNKTSGVVGGWLCFFFLNLVSAIRVESLRGARCCWQRARIP